MSIQKTIGVAMVGLLVAATGAPVEAKTKLQLWYGLTGALGKQVEVLCERFNASQAEYVLECTGKGDYDQALQAVTCPGNFGPVAT